MSWASPTKQPGTSPQMVQTISTQEMNRERDKVGNRCIHKCIRSKKESLGHSEKMLKGHRLITSSGNHSWISKQQEPIWKFNFIENFYNHRLIINCNCQLVIVIIQLKIEQI